MKQQSNKGKGRPSFSFDPENPLARCDQESQRANTAFRNYVDYGSGRSLTKLAEMYQGWIEGIAGGKTPPTKRIQTLEDWSRLYGWQARLQGWLDGEDRKNRKRLDELRQQRIKQVLEKDFTEGEQLRDQARASLNAMPDFLQDTKKAQTSEREYTEDGVRVREITIVRTVRMSVSLTQVARTMRAGSEMQRLALGLSTDQVDNDWRKELAQLGMDPDQLLEDLMKKYLDAMEAAEEPPAEEDWSRLVLPESQ